MSSCQHLINNNTLQSLANKMSPKDLWESLKIYPRAKVPVLGTPENPTKKGKIMIKLNTYSNKLNVHEHNVVDYYKEAVARNHKDIVEELNKFFPLSIIKDQYFMKIIEEAKTIDMFNFMIKYAKFTNEEDFNKLISYKNEKFGGDSLSKIIADYKRLPKEKQTEFFNKMINS